MVKENNSNLYLVQYLVHRTDGGWTTGSMDRVYTFKAKNDEIATNLANQLSEYLGKNTVLTHTISELRRISEPLIPKDYTPSRLEEKVNGVKFTRF